MPGGYEGILLVVQTSLNIFMYVSSGNNALQITVPEPTSGRPESRMIEKSLNFSGLAGAVSFFYMYPFAFTQLYLKKIRLCL